MNGCEGSIDGGTDRCMGKTQQVSTKEGRDWIGILSNKVKKMKYDWMKHRRKYINKGTVWMQSAGGAEKEDCEGI